MLNLMAETDRATLDEHTTDEHWTRIAESRKHLCRLDESSLLVMRKCAGLEGHAREPGGALDRKATWLETRLALDTVQNEYRLHRQVHEWLSRDAALVADPDALVSRVYAELFLTPDEDPWLGLVSDDAYAALEGERGRCAPPATPVAAR
jgi:hypothetical protein